MFDKLLSFFQQEEVKTETHKPELAAAALLVEIMNADHSFSDEESDSIKSILFDTLFITAEVADELLATAKKQVNEATDLFQFTEVINTNYSAEEKVSLIESLWKVAYSDKQLDKYEEHMIRRIADLLYVSHSDFMQTKNRIKAACE
ncbi:MAG: TerB family tellurite resistance protein [Oleispira sp.]|nr:TerB family tellurite resistance protein [Oleispira sp.]